MKLPDLPPAPSTDLQFLLRSLLERDDFTAIEPILDELQASGRVEERRQFHQWIGSCALSASRAVRYSPWNEIKDQITHLFWADLFDRTAAIQRIAESVAEVNARVGRRDVDFQRLLQEQVLVGNHQSSNWEVVGNQEITISGMGGSYTVPASGVDVGALREALGLPPVQEGGNGT